MGLQNAAASNVLATLGAVFWSIQLIPQIVKSYRDKSTKGLSAWLMAIWSTAGVFLGANNISQRSSVPLIVQPECFLVLCSTSCAQCLYYDHGISRLQAVLGVVTFACVGGGLQAGFVAASRAGERHGTSAPKTLWGVLTAVFIIGGLLPQYYEIWKYRRVFGISFLFLFIDLLGGLVSCLSLVFQPPPFDAVTAVSYAGLVVLEAGVFLLAAILNPIARRKDRDAKTQDDTDAASMQDRTLPESNAEPIETA